MDTPQQVKKDSRPHSQEALSQDEISKTEASGLSNFLGMQHAIKQLDTNTLTPNSILQLQRTIGNQAVQELLTKDKLQRNVIPPRHVVSPATTRPLPFITVKINGQWVDHWWIEISGSESYGWWPLNGNADTFDLGFSGVTGELNAVGRQPGTSPHIGTATRDPWHGETPPEQFHPHTIGRSNSLSDDEIRDAIRAFARGFSGDYRIVGGPNCHTFIQDMMRSVGLSREANRHSPVVP